MDSGAIAFSRRLVPGVKSGAKTQTRRLVKLPRDRGAWEATTVGGPGVVDSKGRPCPEQVAIWNTTTGTTIAAPYTVGERRWVREDYRIVHQDGLYVQVEYLADGAVLWKLLTPEDDAKLRARKTPPSKAQPGRFLYRSCSRITLEVTGVRVERLRDITEEDARAEGAVFVDHGTGKWGKQLPGWHMDPEEAAKGWEHCLDTARLAFGNLWNKLHEKDGHDWYANPWCWAISFRRVA